MDTEQYKEVVENLVNFVARATKEGANPQEVASIAAVAAELREWITNITVRRRFEN